MEPCCQGSAPGTRSHITFKEFYICHGVVYQPRETEANHLAQETDAVNRFSVLVFLLSTSLNRNITQVFPTPSLPTYPNFFQSIISPDCGYTSYFSPLGFCQVLLLNSFLPGPTTLQEPTCTFISLFCIKPALLSTN